MEAAAQVGIIVMAPVSLAVVEGTGVTEEDLPRHFPVAIPPMIVVIQMPATAQMVVRAVLLLEVAQAEPVTQVEPAARLALWVQVVQAPMETMMFPVAAVEEVITVVVAAAAHQVEAASAEVAEAEDPLMPIVHTLRAQLRM